MNTACIHIFNNIQACLNIKIRFNKVSKELHLKRNNHIKRLRKQITYFPMLVANNLENACHVIDNSTKSFKKVGLPPFNNKIRLLNKLDMKMDK